ncbi:hypothetical protein KQX54_021278 [Cotesia glomerata]|uniref:Uncharacterized protein n=1 Tax=Cotesia glomerata TaxID=32391 RepID=A0AAV7JAF0_COTGL|nr:hypothetical protein KQX54_021278 [Cotesia glomerata]
MEWMKGPLHRSIHEAADVGKTGHGVCCARCVVETLLQGAALLLRHIFNESDPVKCVCSEDADNNKNNVVRAWCKVCALPRAAADDGLSADAIPLSFCASDRW